MSDVDVLSRMALYKTSSDRKKINKTLNLVVDITETFRLKAPCDILRPTVQLSKDTVGDEWDQINYAFIPRFHRYYEIESAVALNDSIIEYTMTVDPLYTYKDQLMRTPFEVARSESLNDKFFVDPELYLQVYRTLEYATVGTIAQDTAASDKTYYITVAAGV